MNIIKVNGKEYLAKKFDFNTICYFEDLGISLEQMQNKPLSMTRAYFAMSSGLTPEQAGLEIQAHLVGGGKFDDITNVMSKEMEESDFFRNLNQNETEEVTETPKKGTKKKSE